MAHHVRMTPRTKALGLAMPALVLVLLTAGCGGGGDDPTPSPTTAAPTTVATTPSTGPQAFLDDVAAAGFGTKDATDPAFTSVGNTACQGLADGVSYGQQVQAFVESDAKPTQAQAETLVRAAVRELCPEHAGMLP